MQHNPPSQNLEMSLREHLLAASSTGQHGSYPPPPSTAQNVGDNPYQQQESVNSHPHMDPSVTGQQIPYGLDDNGAHGEHAKGKRELSTSKRAAQNRAAQRAFRQRKEGYIKKLEEQVKDLQTMEQNHRALQNENFQLREYILNLQSRLLETQSDYPPAPSHINLASSSGAASGSQTSNNPETRREAPQPAAGNHEHPHDAMRQLQAAAAQASEVRPNEYSHAPPDYTHQGGRSEEAGNDDKLAH
ncbi:Hypothetical protein R9X50_00592200 [Acrodontium crateriforme]|uniref:Putative transcription factor kapC n=1 Tax=Acrodontium crateriforme TaxID=150365 RepID=A0AAQ3M8Z8_9PEZI|nr:Hypothetical protein R9X50_00592200 [Acrodontium crateriforme]